MNNCSELRPAPVVIDLQISRRFIAALTGSQDSQLTFQTFDDTPSKRKNLARVLHGTLSQHAAQLRKLNDLGAGVYVTVNETDLRGRRATNVTALRALFVDSDTGALPALALQPTIKVVSARGEHA